MIVSKVTSLSAEHYSDGVSYTPNSKIIIEMGTIEARKLLTTLDKLPERQDENELVNVMARQLESLLP